MNVSSSKAKQLARELLVKNKTRSWREISREDYGSKVNHATLNRVANSRGAWTPKEDNLLILLGIYCKPRRLTPKHLNNDEKTQSWFLWMRELAKSLKTDTPKELAKGRIK